MGEVVVVGVDGSESGARAAHFAGRHAKEAQARLLVAHVVPWSPYAVQTAEDNERRRVTKKEETDAAQSAILDPLLGELEAAGIPAEGVVRHGHPADTLCEIAREAGAVHVFIGRRGESRVKTLLFGSTAGNLIQIATVPVTVVP